MDCIYIIYWYSSIARSAACCALGRIARRTREPRPRLWCRRIRWVCTGCLVEKQVDQDLFGPPHAQPRARGTNVLHQVAYSLTPPGVDQGTSVLRCGSELSTVWDVGPCPTLAPPQWSSCKAEDCRDDGFLGGECQTSLSQRHS